MMGIVCSEQLVEVVNVVVLFKVRCIRMICYLMLFTFYNYILHFTLYIPIYYINQKM